MASKIQENIDLISPNLLDEYPVIPGEDVPPMIS
tara:strand:- start:349 stop:450 length:102 start_codon:yes stop_codon:yes gene_type:complete